jgi:hypothetical protein
MPKYKEREAVEDYYARCAKEIQLKIDAGESFEPRHNIDNFWLVRRLAMYGINHLGIREEL